MNSTIEPGQSKPSAAKNSEDLIDAINQVFALFRRNYHNQYHKAFGDLEELNHVKRLWLEMLSRFTPVAILKGAKAVIESSEYLPTLHTMIHHCEQASNDMAFPDAHDAYLEACRAPSPKASYNWSHLAVYHAGRATDWYFLQTTEEKIAYPIFKTKYLELCSKVRDGMLLDQPKLPQIEAPKGTPLDKKENLSRLEALKSALDLEDE